MRVHTYRIELGGGEVEQGAKQALQVADSSLCIEQRLVATAAKQPVEATCISCTCCCTSLGTSMVANDGLDDFDHFLLTTNITKHFATLQTMYHHCGMCDT